MFCGSKRKLQSQLYRAGIIGGGDGAEIARTVVVADAAV